MTGWLARVQHDLVKRLVWAARDRRELGGRAAPGELVTRLVDEQGEPVGAWALWEDLRARAPAEVSGERLEAFGRAVDGVVAAAERGDVDGVLALEAAFETLRRGRG
jgi:hypothetical protein